MRTVLIVSLLTNLFLTFGCVSFSANEPKKQAPARKEPKPIRSKQVKVAVIDTGIDPDMLQRKEFCNTGHKDFTGNGIQDDHGHGTHIAGIIDQYAKDAVLVSEVKPQELRDMKVNFCMIVIKYYDSNGSDLMNVVHTIEALRWAIDQGVDIINYSGGGIEPSAQEKALIIEALDKGIKVVASAGNEHSDLAKFPFYPAMYDPRIYIVGNGVSNKVKDRAPTSNFGTPVNVWEKGENVLSTLPRGQYGWMTGTSQSAAIKSGKLVRELLYGSQVVSWGKIVE